MSVPLNQLAEFKAAEKALAQQYAAFEEMRNSPELKKALEFDAALTSFLDKHKMTRAGLLDFLKQDLAEPREKRTYKPREPRDPNAPIKERKKPTFKARTYRNPHTGEEHTLRMATSATYQKWAKEYGAEEVKGWLIATE